VDGGNDLYWRKNGSSVTAANVIGRITSGSERSNNAVTVVSDASQKIEVAQETAGGSKESVKSTGFYLPEGM
jgi:hypothetical protein